MAKKGSRCVFRAVYVWLLCRFRMKSQCNLVWKSVEYGAEVSVIWCGSKWDRTCEPVVYRMKRFHVPSLNVGFETGG